ncbi:hypothetical protein [Ochrobactrum chromiisoli]|uniref:Uncharacterized protein n=1 Tax=Ochrobactrum chromiisoli TaxID=2993941 RepID=A0ABT3QUT2_9HYPH|nr:hypothetical protein [Ochrobactrum chromiisoli]MCX2699370.1 hypothetical protein [Ochrobactrum chromiisoli]
MGMQTNFIVQSYSKGARGKLNPDTPFIAKDVAHARRTAERMALSSPMVIAFTNTGDAETGDFEPPKLIFAHGDQLPSEVDEMERV